MEVEMKPVEVWFGVETKSDVQLDEMEQDILMEYARKKQQQAEQVEELRKQIEALKKQLEPEPETEPEPEPVEAEVL